MRSVVNATTYLGSVKRLTIHPKYSDKTNDADIAIVVVRKNKSSLFNFDFTQKQSNMPFQLNLAVPWDHPTFKPIRIENILISRGMECVLSGWGLTNITSVDQPERLNIGSLKIITDEDCKRVFDFKPDNTICGVGANACQAGDTIGIRHK